MRWFLIDRFLEFQSGEYAVAVKNITLSDEPIDGYSSARPSFPPSLIIEGLAQMGGLLTAQLSDFEKRVVLAKINKTRFHFQATPGDTLRYRVTLDSVLDTGAVASGTVHVGDRQLAEAQLMFAQLDARFEGIELFEPAGFCRSLRVLRVFEVGRDRDGNPLKIPQHMLEAERASLTIG